MEEIQEIQEETPAKNLPPPPPIPTIKITPSEGKGKGKPAMKYVPTPEDLQDMLGRLKPTNLRMEKASSDTDLHFGKGIDRFQRMKEAEKRSPEREEEPISQRTRSKTKLTDERDEVWENYQSLSEKLDRMHKRIRLEG